MASYPLVNPTTEDYIGPNSLLFDTYAANGNRFFAGSPNRISAFDLSRPGESPFYNAKTIPSKRKKIVGGGVGIKGIVSSLAMNCDKILAAGMFSRCIGLYDGGGTGGTVGLFKVGENPHDAAEIGEGDGITQVLWSICGRYLCAVERKSDGIGVWDIRVTGRRLSWCKGRRAVTTQRLSVDLVEGDIWAGGTDGVVRVWDGVGKHEGVRTPTWDFKAHEGRMLQQVMLE